MNKKSLMLLFVLVFFSLAFAAAGGTSGIKEAITGLCKDAKTIMLAAMILMAVLAAIVYAAGQIMGAETRARATVWATAMLTGAVIAAVIYSVTPWIIDKVIVGTSTSVSTFC